MFFQAVSDIFLPSWHGVDSADHLAAKIKDVFGR
jgi:hypothetical protein